MLLSDFKSLDCYCYYYYHHHHHYYWDRIPVRARFSTTAQTDPGARPTTYELGTECVSRGLKRSVRGADHPTHLAPRLKKE